MLDPRNPPTPAPPCQVGVISYILLCGAMPFDPLCYREHALTVSFPEALFGDVSEEAKVGRHTPRGQLCGFLRARVGRMGGTDGQHGGGATPWLSRSGSHARRRVGHRHTAGRCAILPRAKPASPCFALLRVLSFEF